MNTSLSCVLIKAHTTQNYLPDTVWGKYGENMGRILEKEVVCRNEVERLNAITRTLNQIINSYNCNKEEYNWGRRGGGK